MKGMVNARTLLVVLGLAIAAVVAMPTLDLPVSRWCFTHKDWEKPWDELRDGIMLAETFGHAWGVLFVLLAVYLLDPARRSRFGRFVFAVIAAGFAPGLVKLCLVRYRPRYFFSETFPSAPENVQQTFGGFQRIFSSDFHSFPSGHSALACGLAVVLIRLYPRGRALFAVAATLVMVQRVVVTAHFPSDTLAGAALGILVASLCMPCEVDPSLKRAGGEAGAPAQSPDGPL